MSQTIAEKSTTVPRSKRGEPTWEIATLFPIQGEWSESEYLALETNHFVELVDGCVEVLPMPSVFHQLILDFLLTSLKSFVKQNADGTVLFAPLPVKLGTKHYREPDIVYLRPGRITDVTKQPFGADLIMEIVSPGDENRKRDFVEKRDDYAKAKVAEYWIVDPEEKKIHVLKLDGDKYVEHGIFGEGDAATSALLVGFAVKVSEVFAVAEKA